MQITKQEMALVEYVRGLCFEAVLDAGNGIESEQNKAKAMSDRCLREGEIEKSKGFLKRAKELGLLVEHLGEANADYHAHILDDQSEPELVEEPEAKPLKEMVGTITCDGKEVSFRQFLLDASGTGEIYDDMYGDILYSAWSKKPDWIEVDDILCPIAEQLLVEAIEEDEDVYYDLVTALQTAYRKLKAIHEEKCRKETEEAAADREYFLDRDKPEFFGEFDGLIHEFALGKVVKHFETPILGQYRVVIGFPDGNNETV